MAACGKTFEYATIDDWLEDHPWNPPGGFQTAPGECDILKGNRRRFWPPEFESGVNAIDTYGDEYTFTYVLTYDNLHPGVEDLSVPIDEFAGCEATIILSPPIDPNTEYELDAKIYWCERNGNDNGTSF